MHIDPSVLERQVKRMEQIIDKKAAVLDKENYDKYIHVFETAIKYLKRKPILLYGGLAIHEIMPKSLKIYDEYTLPDIDVFTYKPGELAKGLVKHMKDQGYELTTYGEALHEGTLKIYSQGQQIVDMTFIPKSAFRKLAKKSMVGDLGLRVVDPQYLRMSLHKMLAATNLDRWPKVLKRIVNFYQAYPPAKCNVSSVAAEASKIPTELIDLMYDTPALRETVFLGAREIELITNKPIGVNMFEGVPPVIGIVRDAYATAKEIVAQMPGWELKISERFKTDVVSPLPAHVFITYRRKKVALLFDAISCFSFNTFKGRRVATLHSILYIYLSILASTHSHFDKMTDSLECIANALSLLQLNAFQSKRILLQQFTNECFGTQEGLATLRRARLERRNK